jgi:D-glycero-alpha-D-manno-heptose 1-phosphate guanylyltransferase
MEAIVLAGGFGTRLHKVVADVPKPMAPIAGRPFLEILLSSLSRKGFSRVVLSLGFKAKLISDFFGSRFAGMDLEYVVEEIPLGTGGATRLAAASCDRDHFFVFNGDTYLDLDAERLEELWQTKKNSIVVGRWVQDTARFGRLLLKDDRITSFDEKGISGSGVINAGCYVLARDALSKFPLNQPFSIEIDYLNHEVINKAVYAFVTEGMFIDIGVPEDYARAQILFASV